jgi:membrane protease YdiL (CAAX protease family)
VSRVPFVPLRPIPLRTAIWSFLLGVALVAPVMIVAGFVPVPTTDADASRPLRFLNYMMHPGGLFLKAVILAPLWEELFYRGLILQLARRYLPTRGAIALAALIFALPHASMGFGTAVLALMMGTALGWLVVRSGSLLASMFCHATINLCWLFVLGPAFGITERIMSYTPDAPRINPLTDLFPLWWIGFSLVLGVAAVVMLNRGATPSRAARG